MPSSRLKHGCAVGDPLLLKASIGVSARGRQGYCAHFKNHICALSRDFISFNAQFLCVCLLVLHFLMSIQTQLDEIYAPTWLWKARGRMPWV